MHNQQSTDRDRFAALTRDNEAMRREIAQLRAHLVSMDSQRQDVTGRLNFATSAMRVALISIRNGSPIGACVFLEGALTAGR